MYSQESYHDQFYAEDKESGGRGSLSAITRLATSGSSVLDYGCGNGDFLRSARAAGFDAVGVEVDPSARITAAARSGCPVIAPDALSAEKRRYAIIRLGDVLEHLPDPTRTLRHLERLVVDGGWLVIEGPLENNTSLVGAASRTFGVLKRLLRGQPDANFPPFHLFRVDARTQRRYFSDRLGYSVVTFDVDETGWPYWIDGDRLARPNGAAHFLRMVTGLAAIGLTRVMKRFGFQIGNRFVAVLAVPHRQDAT